MQIKTRALKCRTLGVILHYKSCRGSSSIHGVAAVFYARFAR